MKKSFIFAAWMFICACATPLMYDQAKFSISSDVKLLNITTQSSTRERDGQTQAQVIGVSAKNQTVYYKTEWFDANGFKISTTLNQWKKANLRKDAEFIWNFVAPSPRAVAYRVYISNNIGNGIIE